MHYDKLQLYAIGVGSIIGWGAFVLPGDLFIKSAGPFLTTVALFIAAIFMSIIGWAYRTVIQSDVDQKSPLTVVYKLFGHWHGFIYGWALCISYIAIVGLNVTTLALLLRFYFGTEWSGQHLYSLFGWDVYLLEIALCLFALLVFALANMRKTLAGANLQKLITIVLCFSVLSLSLALLASESASIEYWGPIISEQSSSWTGFFTIIAIAPWAFVGFEIIPQLARHSALTGSQIYQTMLFSLLTGALIYIFIALSSALTFPWEQVADKNSEWLVGYVVRDTLGAPGILVLGVAMLCSVMAGINGFLIASSRLIYNMADLDFLPRIFKHSPSNKSELVILFVTSMAAVTPFLGRNALLLLVEVSSIGIATAFLYMCYSALRISKNYNFNYCISLLGLVVACIFLALLMIPGSPALIRVESFLIFALYMIIGVCLYALHRMKASKNLFIMEN